MTRHRERREQGLYQAEGAPAVPLDPSTAEGLDAMTKQQLLEYAQTLGVSPANNDMTKAELRAGVDAKLAEGGG